MNGVSVRFHQDDDRGTALNRAIACMILVAPALANVPASAQGWKPEKNVEIVVGLTAGSSQDRTGRAVSGGSKGKIDRRLFEQD
jgi:tripartite-type tricarboxylate transporter receptor subunit TctC